MMALMRPTYESAISWKNKCSFSDRATHVAAVLIVTCSLLQLWEVDVVRADVYSAIVDLERLLVAEKAIAGNLRQYIEKEYKRLQQLTRVADDLERHSAEAMVDPERHLGNPINAFLLIKRFTVDWERVVNSSFPKDDADDFLASLSSKTGFFPTNDDLTGAVEALLRIQDTYALTAEQISKGNLSGVRDSPRLTANDCYQIGAVAYAGQDYYHTILWMNEALRVYETESVKTIDQALLLDHVAYSLYMQGNVRHALALTEQWLRIEPDHPRAQNNRNYYMQMIADEVAKSGSHHGSEPSQSPPALADIDFSPRGDPINQRPMDTYKASHEFQSYERLCRGEQTRVNPLKEQLSCRYLRHHPMFYLRPVKEETLYHNPQITIYHDVITESEMSMVRQLARPRLERSVVYHAGPAGTFVPQNYRISKSAWLSDWESPLISRISQRAGAISNLTLESAEQLQVLNYGIGGHYEPHYDFSTRTELGPLEKQQGNRIATFLCYAKQVTAGGSTVFPQIGVQVSPNMGSCALWYNLYRTGEGDFNTRHAACPVISGFKWVCNKWFHERGQEYIRPCATSASD